MGELDKFIASVDSDIAWRKIEVSKIIAMHNEQNSELVVKSSVLLTYSHWEGCVKNLCKLYLGYVSNLSLDLSELTDNYKAIALKGNIKQMIGSSETLTMANELAFIASMDSEARGKFSLKSSFKKSDKDKSIINTKGNLSYQIFDLFLKIVGVDERACLHTKKFVIDERLLKNRNKIAHGNRIDSKHADEFDLEIESVKAIKSVVFSIIDSLSADLKYYAENKYYLVCNRVIAKEYNIQSNDKLESQLAGLSG
jgi:hypothetical protein